MKCNRNRQNIERKFVGWVLFRSVINTKESDGIADPMRKIAIKSHTDHSDSGIGIMLVLIDAYFVILLQCNKMTK